MNPTFGTHDLSLDLNPNYQTSLPPRPPKKDSVYAESTPVKPGARDGINVETSPQPYPRQTSSDEPQNADFSWRQQKRKGFFSTRKPWFVYCMTTVQIGVFVGQIIKNSMLTGSPIMIHPKFNPMIGPSTYVQINMGARFVPCMRTDPQIQGVEPPINWPCPNTTTSDTLAASNHCDLSELCGFGGLDNDNPNQWFRFILPIFLHAGLIHIGFNMLLQLTMGKDMEQTIGTIRFALVYFSSGIFGFVLGGNFAPKAIASTGASGSLFGVLALTLLDLIYHWQSRRRPVRDLMWILADIIISFVLGLLPGLDNFSHIGGFLMGLGAGVCILHSPAILRQRIGHMLTYRHVESDIDLGAKPVSPSGPKPGEDVTKFTKFTQEPVGFFKGRKPLWWAWWLMRAGALIGVLVGFVLLLNNFYTYRNNCNWCKYLTCLPINGWCNLGNLQLTNYTTNGTSTSKRHLAGVLVKELDEIFLANR
ncbi:hypothetical protein DV735_g1343, partial [Chaetothyriales sp. CBS 134920]